MMFISVPSDQTKADKPTAVDCSNVQPKRWQYSCWLQAFVLHYYYLHSKFKCV